VLLNRAASPRGGWRDWHHPAQKGGVNGLLHCDTNARYANKTRFYIVSHLQPTQIPPVIFTDSN
jgi:hypothetical protein